MEVFNPTSRTLRLCTSQEEGGRGLLNIRATIQGETTKIQAYIRKMPPDDDLKVNASGSRNPIRTRRRKKRDYNGETSPCTGCTAGG